MVDAGIDSGVLVDRWFGVPEGTPITASMGDLQVRDLAELFKSGHLPLNEKYKEMDFCHKVPTSASFSVF